MRGKVGQNHPWDTLMLLHRDSAHGLIYIDTYRIIQCIRIRNCDLGRL